MRTFRPGFSGSFPVSCVLFVQTHAAEKRLQQLNARRTRMRPKGVQKPNKLKSRVCTVVDKHNPSHPQEYLLSGGHFTHVEESLFIRVFHKGTSRSNEK